MKRKHLARKKGIHKLTEAELEFNRKGTNRDVFDLKYRQLKHNVAPGLGCLRNEHILAILINLHRQVTPSAYATTRNFFGYENAIVQVKMLDYFYKEWVSIRLVPANKADPGNQPPGTVPDYRPVNISNAERWLFTHSYFDKELQSIYNKPFGTAQNRVRIEGGISSLRLMC
jgi:hypothetical protein